MWHLLLLFILIKLLIFFFFFFTALDYSFVGEGYDLVKMQNEEVAFRCEVQGVGKNNFSLSVLPLITFCTYSN